MTSHPRWHLARTALICLAVDPGGLGGLWLRARVGPVRDRFLDALTQACGRGRRLHPEMGDEALFGGVDVAASLAAGHLVRTEGLLAGAGLLTLPMAERARPGLAARLAGALDAGRGQTLLALDEGTEDEALPATLAERLGLHLDLDGLALADTDPIRLDPARVGQARDAAPDLPDDAIATLAQMAAMLGVTSLRAPILALRAARALAAWDGADMVSEDHLAAATALVLAPRATRLPETEVETDQPDTSEPPPPPETPDDTENAEGQSTLPSELLLEAAKAVIPPDLLDRLAAQKAIRAAQAGAGAGERRRGNRRGRPLPSRQGLPDGDKRIDLVGTLRAAAPWQRLRQATKEGLQIRRSDIRLRQFEEQSDRAVIFVVDASGSAAMARLAEAKGAVELLLAQAYARRDHVALIAFRGTDAELLLPPTRSLVQTKRRLAELPGGGGTPLAAGLRDALMLGLNLRGRGMTPAIALMTDGRANVTLAGTGGRAQAGEEATGFARQIRAKSLPSLVIDTGLRPTRGLDGLAQEMGAGYLPLPRADAGGLSRAVSDVMMA